MRPAPLWGGVYCYAPFSHIARGKVYTPKGAGISVCFSRLGCGRPQKRNIQSKNTPLSFLCLNTPATIGDNVYIGPQVCIVENVKIHDNATIGAGAIVTKDVPANATVAGVPAKVLNYNNPGRYVNRRYPTPLPSSPNPRP